MVFRRGWYVIGYQKAGDDGLHDMVYTSPHLPSIQPSKQGFVHKEPRVSNHQTFSSPADIKEALSRQEYIAGGEIATTSFLSQQLGKPLLAEGPAGVGKTELAKAIAGATGRKLIRLQCYEGLDETKALYEWEYAKQLLYTQLLGGKLQELLAESTSMADAADRLAAEDDVFFSMRFLLKRPLLEAILSEEPTVLLIDEIDRADAEFEAFSARSPQRLSGERSRIRHLNGNPSPDCYLN